MLDRDLTTIPKWPFMAGDLLLIALAAGICFQLRPLTDWHLLAVGGLVVAGAGLGALPFVLEQRGKVRLAEVRGLATVAEQIPQLRGFTNQISFATAQWQVVQEQSEKSVESARALAERMAAESKAFTDFLKDANENEKRQLRLEVEKLRKAEVEWLQIAVRLLDHVHALHQAGLRSGQARLVEQLGRFQHACRDTVRRAGLVPFEPSPDEPFNEQLHQLHNSQDKPVDGARIGQTLAPGFNYQGRLLRPALVAIAGNGAHHVPAAENEPPPSPAEA